MSEGKPSNCAYIVETGTVEVSIINDYNERQVLGQLKVMASRLRSTIQLLENIQVHK